MLWKSIVDGGDVVGFFRCVVVVERTMVKLLFFDVCISIWWCMSCCMIELVRIVCIIVGDVVLMSMCIFIVDLWIIIWCRLVFAVELMSLLFLDSRVSVCIWLGSVSISRIVGLVMS